VGGSPTHHIEAVHKQLAGEGLMDLMRLKVLDLSFGERCQRHGEFAVLGGENGTGRGKIGLPRHKKFSTSLRLICWDPRIRVAPGQWK